MSALVDSLAVSVFVQNLRRAVLCLLMLHTALYQKLHCLQLNYIEGRRKCTESETSSPVVQFAVLSLVVHRVQSLAVSLSLSRDHLKLSKWKSPNGQIHPDQKVTEKVKMRSR